MDSFLDSIVFFQFKILNAITFSMHSGTISQILGSQMFQVASCLNLKVFDV